MYPSGRWDGFWEQAGYGRQAMTPFYLTFAAGHVTGEGKDIISRFLFRGTVDAATGRVRMVKQYVGRHAVLYEGGPDGEGCILGTWRIGDDWTGPFLMRPVLERPRGDEPIGEIR